QFLDHEKHSCNVAVPEVILTEEVVSNGTAQGEERKPEQLKAVEFFACFVVDLLIDSQDSNCA
ncbi:hypothetical protein, partial [Escherichia coli]|uniref:hypothetical protein n=1 Tax=Escherichia coli TaxID=562 RepID=UPI001C55C9DD